MFYMAVETTASWALGWCVKRDVAADTVCTKLWRCHSLYASMVSKLWRGLSELECICATGKHSISWLEVTYSIKIILPLWNASRFLLIKVVKSSCWDILVMIFTNMLNVQTFAGPKSGWAVCRDGVVLWRCLSSWWQHPVPRSLPGGQRCGRCSGELQTRNIW